MDVAKFAVQARLVEPVDGGKRREFDGLGRIGLIAPTSMPMLVGRFLVRRCGTRSHSARPSRRMRRTLMPVNVTGEHAVFHLDWALRDGR